MPLYPRFGTSAGSDAWTSVVEAWTFASATTITIPTGGASRYQKGDRLKLTQLGAVAYFYIVGVADTLLTITGGTDYTLSNNPISAIAVSRAASPIGFPGVFNFAGAASGFASFTLQTYQFWIVGPVCTVRVVVSGTSNATSFGVTAPVAQSSGGGAAAEAAFAPFDNGAGLTVAGRASIANGSTAITAFTNMASAAWTASGTKAAGFEIPYPF